jgi:Bacterial regulatory helix-turn-helix protein, lysR family
MSMNAQKIRNVQFAELIEFVVVAEYHSFTRAAVQLGVSTAVLSQTIRAVEDRLGLCLLNRTKRCVVPTPAGERVLDKLRPVLESLESAFDELTEYRDRRPAVCPSPSRRAASHENRFMRGGSARGRWGTDIKIGIPADDGLVDIISGHPAIENIRKCKIGGN